MVLNHILTRSIQTKPQLNKNKVLTTLIVMLHQLILFSGTFWLFECKRLSVWGKCSMGCAFTSHGVCFKFRFETEAAGGTSLPLVYVHIGYNWHSPNACIVMKCTETPILRGKAILSLVYSYAWYDIATALKGALILGIRIGAMVKKALSFFCYLLILFA